MKRVTMSPAEESALNPEPWPWGFHVRFDRSDFYEEGDRWWYCDHAEPVAWFTIGFVELGRRARLEAIAARTAALARGEIGADEPDWSFFGPWFVDGDRIKLVAANGTWIWVLTGLIRLVSNDSGRVRLEARWPD